MWEAIEYNIILSETFDVTVITNISLRLYQKA